MYKQNKQKPLSLYYPANHSLVKKKKEEVIKQILHLVLSKGVDMAHSKEIQYSS